ncbi:PHP domain-containing protein [Halobacteria archaeon AArc-m2/3/4]|uniref:PHP domain-containing protein n=1 Tax=Natronoglomus mannanivorans TaxID=2979990 RepID=A0AAP2YVS7_9EURY|nr:PHP domain-containing protein [Halobacteria archaeon AArc-xg1-1]MCU4973090.1 PHP domain-containing protein [Halobacteria archaeon AArc-m2/3/4]
MTASEEFRVDLHVKVLTDRVVERAIAAGLDAIVYAPHFTRLPEIRARAERYSSDELLVIPAREVFTGSWRERKHVLAIGLADRVPDFISLEAAMAEFERQDAAVLAPHPEFLNVSLTESDLRHYRDTVDAVEIYNPKHLPSHNRRAREIAKLFEYPPFTSSYAHLPGTVGVSYTAFDADLGIDSADDLVTALREGAARRVIYDTGFTRWKTTARELGHLCWENSWEKVDRLFLQGIEATHPHHIAYDGKFDDVSVY